jgi:c(7)-type cytochrome triheme protein
MVRMFKRFLRLCHLMCGRSPTFRSAVHKPLRGYAPTRGVAPKQSRSRERWGRAATAHQAAKPHSDFTSSPIASYHYALVLVGAVISLTLVVVFNSRASGSITNSHSESLYAASNQNQMEFPQGLDYSKFQHSNTNHARLPCLLCHRRETNAPRLLLPGGNGHLPCAGCHAQQFSKSDGPICTLCHTDVKSGALKPFPRLQSFKMKFDHAQHLDMGSIGCATCHRPARGGVALSIPSGFNAHTTCYRCHTPRAQSSGRDISSCGTCHQPGSYSRTPEVAQAFRVGFSHAKHQKVTCSECHKTRAGMPQRRQVTAPEPLNHHATGRALSCSSCHNGKRAFGGDDFTVCNRCHTGKAWHF